MMFIARTVTASCFLLMFIYVVFGASDFGKSKFEDLAEGLVRDKKSAPYFALAVPLLLASSIVSLLNNRKTPTTARRRTLMVNGDGNFDIYSAFFILIPFIIYTSTCICRHLSSGDIITTYNNIRSVSWNGEDANLMAKWVSNSFAMGAMILFPFFLIPVSKHGPIIKFFGWDPARVLRLHIWSGRLIVFGSLVHGAIHLIRWTRLYGERIQSFLVPPKQCWFPNGQEEDFDLNCENLESNCSCYNHFLYLTGTLGGLALVLIILTSTNFVRRKFYSFFYMSHVILAPIFLLMVCLHYNRAMMYIAPALIYYFAASMPVLKHGQSNPEGVRVESVESLGSGPNRCISLTLAATEETVAASLPGYYVQMSVPSISAVGHPFTINKVPGRSDLLRIIFRTSGAFTTSLAEELLCGKRPTIHLDGYHGSSERLCQLLQHECTVLVAGGIGITPYLCLLTSAVSALSQSVEDQDNDLKTRRIVLHWSCRDTELVQYCQAHYFEPLQQQVALLRGCDLEINIHQTGSSQTLCDIKSPCVVTPAFQKNDLCVQIPKGRPFQQSCLNPSQTMTGNIPHFFVHASLSGTGLAVVYFFYSNIQSDNSIIERGFAPLAVVILAYFLSDAMTIAQKFADGFSSATKPSFLGKKKATARKSVNESSYLLARQDTGLNSTSCATLDSYSSSVDEEVPSEITILHHEQGQRPDVQNILKDEVNNLHSSMGVFCCGPSTIAQTIYNFAHQHRNSTSIESNGSKPFIQVYDETFLM